MNGEKPVWYWVLLRLAAFFGTLILLFLIFEVILKLF